MINVQRHLFKLDTTNTSYIFHVDESGHLEHVYYGHRIELADGDWDALRDKHPAAHDCPSYSEDFPEIKMENLALEVSTEGKGDYRVPMVQAEYNGGYTTLDFVYQHSQITKGKQAEAGKAQAYGSADQCTTLTVTLKDTVLDISLTLTYVTFDASDVILRSAAITNKTEHHLYVHKLDSLQLDLEDDRWDLVTFDGAWGREKQAHRRRLAPGTHVNESRSGVSSADHNPLVFLARPEATQRHGEVIGCNLIFSGNHKEEAEVSPFGKTRLLTGVNSSLLRWKLAAGATLASPEAVLTWSGEGFNGASDHFARFVNDHIIRGTWKWRERPVQINTWEAFRFDFDEGKLLNLARHAASLGVELFVLDDGWFASRNDDTSSLGDWYANPQKIPSGLASLSTRIHAMGMMFGLWVEPEMVNRQSQLYLKHPDWVLALPRRVPAVQRHQYILDLTRDDVRSYLYDTLSRLLKDAEVNYVKWDMNRLFSDLYTENEQVKHMGEFSWRYVDGLYDLVGKLRAAFPNVLFEGCSSGGQRYDLGMLCCFDQIWTSDNTDARSRLAIQEGTSYGYPPSTMDCHVSAVPNNQTLRTTPLESRFNVAAFGTLGYELDLTALGREEREAIAAQIEFYKTLRSTFQYGTFHRQQDGNVVQWDVQSQDKETIIVLWYLKENQANYAQNDILLVPEADERAVYDVFPRQQYLAPTMLDGHTARTIHAKRESLPMECEHYTVSGGVLKYAGIKLHGRCLKDYDAQTRIMSDDGSRMYVVKKRG